MSLIFLASKKVAEQMSLNLLFESPKSPQHYYSLEQFRFYCQKFINKLMLHIDFLNDNDFILQRELHLIFFELRRKLLAILFYVKMSYYKVELMEVDFNFMLCFAHLLRIKIHCLDLFS